VEPANGDGNACGIYGIKIIMKTKPELQAIKDETFFGFVKMKNPF